MKQIYNRAPLPFQGQKRHFATVFETVLKQHFSDVKIVVDMFGGSGLLSHVARRALPHATVIYNDYDDYHGRIDNIGHTNALLASLREILKDCPRRAIVKEPYKSAILERFRAEEKRVGYVDYITMSSSLLFSGKYMTCYDTFARETWYNSIIMSEYFAGGYLDGIDIVKMDYRDLYSRYHRCPDVLFVTDPPYLCTDVSTYNCLYWKIADYLNVLDTIRETSCIYFTSSKSAILDLCQWIEARTGYGNPFADASVIEHRAIVNSNANYIEKMLYRRR
ncbi:MAG: DNA adenine methylase [Prevotellaceae bacterium]|jgi:site-specific DNA-adenine methylase|nr:DNA adenine methylase [Prevotellaceae bacterium]